MNELDVREFYQKQFELSNYDINTERWLEQLAKEVKEQIDIHFKRC